MQRRTDSNPNWFRFNLWFYAVFSSGSGQSVAKWIDYFGSCISQVFNAHHHPNLSSLIPAQVREKSGVLINFNAADSTPVQHGLNYFL